MSLLIVGATIIDGSSEEPLEGLTILVQGARIAAVDSRQNMAIDASVQVVDARGKFVMPGMMDANVHLLADIRLQNLVKYEDRFEALIEEAAQVALRAGLTTVFDTWGPRIPLTAVRDRIAAGEVPGSRIYCAGNIVGLDGPYSADFYAEAAEVASDSLVRRINALWVENTGPDLTWMTTEQVLQEIKSYLAKGIDFLKFASSEHRGAESSAFLVFSPTVQARMVEEAHRAGVTAQAHTSSIQALNASVESGCDVIQHCNITGPIAIPAETLEEMGRRQMGAVVFPFTEKRMSRILERAEPIVRRYFACLDTNCRALISCGAPILLGTDAGLLAPDYHSDPKLRNAWYVGGEDNLGALGEGHFVWLKAMEEKGMAPMAALKAATRNIAAAYGKGKDLGTLEAGKIADLVILEQNPLVSAENYRTISEVMKEGKFVNREELPRRPLLTKKLPEECGSVSDSYGRLSASRFPCC